MYMSGGCNCGSVRYELLSEPLFTHVCHCKECQRESGGAFNISTVILTEDFRFKDCAPDISYISRKSGNKYEVWGCTKCGCTVAGKSAAPSKMMVVRPGTFDDTSKLRPQAHIWTKEKQDWINIPDDLPSFEEEYEAEELWPASSLGRAEDI